MVSNAKSPLKPSKEDNVLPKGISFSGLRYLIPLIIGGGIIWILLYQAPWLLHNPNAQDIVKIKDQAADLTNRLEHLEEVARRPLLPSIDPAKMRSLDAALASMRQQIDRLQTASLEPSEEASPPPQNLAGPFEKDLPQLIQAQQTLRSIILFWHLKAKILSGSPYLAELNAYKAHTAGSKDISHLEEYATQGLDALKGSPQKEVLELPQNLLTPAQGQINMASWWQRLQTSVKSLISIKKVETSQPLPAPPDYAEQNRRSVEAILDRLEQVHIHQLTAISLPDLTAFPEGDQP